MRCRAPPSPSETAVRHGNFVSTLHNFRPSYSRPRHYSHLNGKSPLRVHRIDVRSHPRLGQNRRTGCRLRPLTASEGFDESRHEGSKLNMYWIHHLESIIIRPPYSIPCSGSGLMSHRTANTTAHGRLVTIHVSRRLAARAAFFWKVMIG